MIIFISLIMVIYEIRNIFWNIKWNVFNLIEYQTEMSFSMNGV